MVHGKWKEKLNCKGTIQCLRLQASVKQLAYSRDFTASLEGPSVFMQVAKANIGLGYDQVLDLKDAGQERSCEEGLDSHFLPGGNQQLHNPIPCPSLSS